eukprot:1821488-Rhodomonas_salina.7
MHTGPSQPPKSRIPPGTTAYAVLVLWYRVADTPRVSTLVPHTRYAVRVSTAVPCQFLVLTRDPYLPTRVRWY